MRVRGQVRQVVVGISGVGEGIGWGTLERGMEKTWRKRLEWEEEYG